MKKFKAQRDTRRITSANDRVIQRATTKQLEVEHFKELERKLAQVWNLGWFQSPKLIQSKTDKGILSSSITRRGRIRHEWLNRAGEAMANILLISFEILLCVINPKKSPT